VISKHRSSIEFALRFNLLFNRPGSLTEELAQEQAFGRVGPKCHFNGQCQCPALAQTKFCAGLDLRVSLVWEFKTPC